MEQERSQIAEKEAEKAIVKATEREALDRFGTIEAQVQTFITKFGQNTPNFIPVDSLESWDPIPTTDSRITTPNRLPHQNEARTRSSLFSNRYPSRGMDSEAVKG